MTVQEQETQTNSELTKEISSEVLLLQLVKSELKESKNLQEAQERIDGLIKLASAISIVEQNQKKLTLEELAEEAFKRKQEKDKLIHFICQKTTQVMHTVEQINDFWLTLYDEDKTIEEAVKVFERSDIILKKQ